MVIKVGQMKRREVKVRLECDVDDVWKVYDENGEDWRWFTDRVGRWVCMVKMHMSARREAKCNE